MTKTQRIRERLRQIEREAEDLTSRAIFETDKAKRKTYQEQYTALLRLYSALLAEAGQGVGWESITIPHPNARRV